jgi:hypothetical protein
LQARRFLKALTLLAGKPDADIQSTVICGFGRRDGFHMNDFAINISRFCILFFCTMAFLTLARKARDARMAFGVRYQTMFRAAAVVSGSIGILCLCLAGIRYLD